VSTSTPTFLPSGTIRGGFEAAARTHEAARSSGTARQIGAAQASRTGVPVEAAIARAAEATTVDFGYLLAQAEVESSMNPEARAATSSATGLYQFIETTWLDTVKKHGHRFGLGDLAAQIDVTASGSAYVADPAQRQAILALRADPEVASLMAAGLAEDNRAPRAPILGRQPDPVGDAGRPLAKRRRAVRPPCRCQPRDFLCARWQPKEPRGGDGRAGKQARARA
jgi:hypothetical protein